MPGAKSLAARSLAPAIAIGAAQSPVLLELTFAVANAPLSLAIVSFAAALLGGALELRDLLRGERPVQLLLQLGERSGARGAAGAACDDESQRAIEAREFRLAQRAGELLWKPQPRDTECRAVLSYPFFHVVVNLNVATADRDSRWQRRVSLADVSRHESVG